MRVYTNSSYTYYADTTIFNFLLMQTYVKLSSMANMLSLAEVTSDYDVNMNKKVDPAMYVHAQGKRIVLINFRPASTTLILTTSMSTSQPISSPIPTIVLLYLDINMPLFNKWVLVILTPILIVPT